MIVAVYLFAIQIYGDFCGYTDIARGVAKLLGIELTTNFRQPYFSRNVTEFWRRWHISLSTWLRDYLYIPLGGNRHGSLNTYRNLMATMLMGGLWHGASWNFVIWGGLHGLFLALHRAYSRGRPMPQVKAWWDFFGVFATFNLVCVAWVFFRADGFDQAMAYLAGIAAATGGIAPGVALAGIVYLPATLLIDLPCWRYEEQHPFRSHWPYWGRGILYAAMILAMALIGPSDVRPFIYFQF